VSQALAVVGGRTFASVRKHRNYRLYFAGQAVSFTGTWMQQIAASWLVLQMTHSAVAVGALALAQLLPVTVFGLFVGTLIDRLDVRLTAIRCEFLSMITAIALAALTLSGAITVWELYFLAVVQGVINALDGPSRHSLIFQMVGPEDLHNAVSLSSSLGTVARILGPAIGGIVVAFAGAGVCFALNAASFLAVLLSLLALDKAKLRQPARDRTSTLIGGARDGLRYVRRSRRAGVAFAVVFVLATFSFNFNVLLPLVADRTLHQGAQTFGFIAAIFGAGALCGALVNATHGVASLRRLLIGAIGFGVFELVLAPQHSLFVISALLFATGVSYTLWGTNALSVLQLEAPEHLRGRAASMYFFAFQGGAPLGGLFAGWMTTVGGTLLAFSIGGVLSLGTAALGIVRLSTRPA
jgi:MFS family permease